ncbi:TIGR03759 family integrating conjugative element protein [Yersinia kristensenii]|uniref:TIGR03759 family integrating conjugative element protein n=1 Tax=Yersinia kristensenii TaxID=28152 RepID=UPI0022FED961|nr:TIGR03759 family integrating conjugative element protein [Yersinia kristensenii]MDA5490233.1 TIGR03759 family integrating conjugative element protein [Yersinia kristensenii]
MKRINRLPTFVLLINSVSVYASMASSVTDYSLELETVPEKSVQLQSRQNAQQWGLSDTEWQQYQQLRQGKRGIQSPGLDPLTMLGVESETPSERRRLAELWVKEEYQRTEKELAFQREVNAAWSRLYPRVLSVNMGYTTGIAQDTHGRLALFVRENCARCDARLAAVLADKQPVDIYLVGSDGKDSRVHNWAISRNIPVDKVRAGQITLNHDRGLWRQYGHGKMPVVLQKGENGWQIFAF